MVYGLTSQILHQLLSCQYQPNCFLPNLYKILIDLFVIINFSRRLSISPFDICLFRGGGVGVGWFRLFKVPTFGITTFKASSKASRGLLGLSSNGVSRSTEPESTLKMISLVNEMLQKLYWLTWCQFWIKKLLIKHFVRHSA